MYYFAIGNTRAHEEEKGFCWTLFNLKFVNASRIPPRPLAGQRLEGAGQQLQAWTSPGESSWTRLGVSKASSGERLEAAWGLQNLSWRALGGVLEAP